MKKVKLNVCQGVGDIFWVYQKFAPHVDVIDLSISQVTGGEGKIGTRAIEFLKLLPKVREITTHTVSSQDYNTLAAGRFPMGRILDAVNSGATNSFDYACNRPLEEGVRIEDIDPLFSVETTTDIRCDEYPLPFASGDYVCMYVSGTTADRKIVADLKLWTVQTWVKFVSGFYKQYNLRCPIVIIGASYDSNIMLQLNSALKSAGHKTAVFIDSLPANVTYILKNSKCFIGYQSGLNILADNLNTRQVMLYFPFLKKMLNTWCKAENLLSGRFNASTFDMTPEQVLDGLRLKF